MVLSFGWLIWAPALAGKIGDHFLWAANGINFAIAGAAWLVADAHPARADAQSYSRLVISE